MWQQVSNPSPSPDVSAAATGQARVEERSLHQMNELQPRGKQEDIIAWK